MRKRILATVRFGLAVLVAIPLAGGLANGRSAQDVPDRSVWSREELDILATLRLSQLPPAPSDPSNAVEESHAAAELGKRLFNDVRFSQNQAVSCATCHDPKRQFQDGLPVGRGVGVGSRRAMPIVGSAYSPWLFWDGRKDSLWAQALGPLEDAAEHGGNRVRYAHLIQAYYRSDYEAIFQAMPDLSSVPSDAAPTGAAAEVAAWSTMAGKQQNDVGRVFANVGKAIAAYERTLTHGESRFDRYVEAVLRREAGADRLLQPGEVNGLRTFIGKGQCITCHNGPLFTDLQFHNTGVPPRDSSRLDHGRATAIAKVQADEFNCIGRFSDAKPAQCGELRFIATGDPRLDGAFKTPGLRDVALRPPYMHAGQFASLEEVIAHYVEAPPAVLGQTELSHGGNSRTGREPIRLSARESKDLASFLETLSGPIIERNSR